MEYKNGDFKVSVRNLVEFIRRSGDIDNRSVYGRDNEAMQEGIRLHKKIQKSMGSFYIAEVPVKMSFSYEEFSITVEGRADGILTKDDKVTIDEIKCMYRKVSNINEPFDIHLSQAKCYAYMYAVINELKNINITVTYCNIETEDINRFNITFEIEELEKWFKNLIDEYYMWAKFYLNHYNKRQDSIKDKQFPFKYRNGQRNLVVSVYNAIKEKENLYIQAPTGIGKTMSTVFPAVVAMGQDFNDKIFYLTAKTITRGVAIETFNVLRNNGISINTVVISAKEKMCPNEEMECNPISCKRAKGHFDRINNALFSLITQKDSITKSIIEEYAEKFNVCPYELALDTSNWCDTIICDYNYVFDPVVKLKRYFSDGSDSNNVFLIDEAHNMVDRGREMYSASLFLENFTQLEDIFKELNKKISNLAVKCKNEMIHLKRECSDYRILEPVDINQLLLRLMRLHDQLDKFLQERMEFENRKQVLDIFFNIKFFLDIFELMDDGYVIYTKYYSDGFMLKLFCINPSKNIKECLDKSRCSVFFSATLLPIRYYKMLLTGSQEDKAIYVESPFSKNDRKIFIGNDITSKYTRRGENTYLKLIDYIMKAYNAKPGNYMVFLPSYQLIDEVYSLINAKDQKFFVKQTQNMTEEEKEMFINMFEKEDKVIALCVLGGIFSEGIDLVEDKLVGSLIFGTGYPQICAEREILRKYFDDRHINGFDYAYKYPGINKVMQAAGRVIRTDRDRGIIGLLDYRFLEKSYIDMFKREWSDYTIIDSNSMYSLAKIFWESKCK